MAADSGQSIILKHFLNVEFTAYAGYLVVTSYIMSHHCYVNWYGQNILELKVLKVSSSKIESNVIKTMVRLLSGTTQRNNPERSKRDNPKNYSYNKLIKE